jgi:hypothetical protein
MFLVCILLGVFIMSLSRLAKLALDVQDACNLSGVIHSWSRSITELRSLCPDLGTDDINRHPINVLFSDKVVHLTGSGDVGDFTKAYDECVSLSQLPL